MQPRHRQHYFARIPTIALLIFLGIAPWLAAVLFILRAIDRDAEKRELGQGRYARADGSPPRQPGAPYDYAAQYGPTPRDLPTAEQRQARKGQRTLTTWSSILGVFLIVIGGLGLADEVSYALSLAAGAGPLSWVDWSALFTALLQVAGGAGALAVSLRLKRIARLERQLDKVVGDRDNIPLDELFAAAGIPAREGRALLEQAIDHGCFGPDAYIDNRTDFLIVRGDAPIPAPPAQEEPAPDGETQYQKLLRQLREAAGAIDDGELRAKAARLEKVSGRIFALAEADPAKAEQLRKFTGYYLPTAIKLLRTYAQLEGQGVDGETISSTKQRIEGSLDLLVTAFENQLDKLFQSDALDVSADIAALEGMLSLDGLSGENDFSLS